MFQTAGKLKIGDSTVTPVANAGSPAILATSSGGEVIALPQGSKVVKTEYSELPATKETPAQPARQVTEIIPAGPTTYTKTENKVSASSGTVDQTLALKKVEAGESRPLLYASIAMAVLCGVFFWLKYPSPALMCAAGSLILFLAWRMTSLPSWFWVLAVVAGGGAVGLWFGHERAENTALGTAPKP